jgi:hypothetical protein
MIMHGLATFLKIYEFAHPFHVMSHYYGLIFLSRIIRSLG